MSKNNCSLKGYCITDVKAMMLANMFFNSGSVQLNLKNAYLRFTAVQSESICEFLENVP